MNAQSNRIMTYKEVRSIDEQRKCKQVSVSTFGITCIENKAVLNHQIWSGFGPVVAFEQTKFYLKFKYSVPPPSPREQGHL